MLMMLAEMPQPRMSPQGTYKLLQLAQLRLLHPRQQASKQALTSVALVTLGLREISPQEWTLSAAPLM